jgi:glycosyltransferase involved in cell wall biosynthesis
VRLLFVADGRSPIALNWIRHFVDRGHEVHLVSTFACSPEMSLASLTVVPVAFSGGTDIGGTGAMRPARFIRLRAAIRHWLGPFTLPAAARRLSSAIDRIRPDLVHAMRIPFEGMLAAQAAPPVPLLVSTWGNDLTLHAPASPWMRRPTRLALKRADGLHADCTRDARLAVEWGYPSDRPIWVLPGNGGVRTDIFNPAGRDTARLEGVPAEVPVIINPRGFRSYVRTDTFFRAIPLVLERRPQAMFVCPAMAGEAQAEAWVARLDLRSSVRLLPKLDPAGMASAFRRAAVAVSPSEHDGTPNSLLEAMACGCFPIAGDLESLREWLTPGENGLLIDAASPEALAAAIDLALDDAALRSRAVEHNARLIVERANFAVVMPRVEAIYAELAARGRSQTGAML